MSVWLWLEVHLTTAFLSSSILCSAVVLTFSMLVLAQIIAYNARNGQGLAKEKLRKQLIDNIAEQIRLENEALQGQGKEGEKGQLEEIQKLEKDIGNLESENKKIGDILNSITAQKNGLEREIQNKRNELRDQEANEKRIAEENSALEAKIDEATENSRAHARELSLMKDKYRHQEQENSNLKGRISSLEGKIEKEEENIRNLESQILEDQSNLEELETEMEENSRKLREKDKVLGDVERKFDGLKRAFEKLEFMEDKDSKLSALIDTTEISKEVAETKIKLTALQSTHDHQSSTVSELNTQITTLTSDLQKANTQKASLEKELLQIKTRSKVIADFYTDRDLKFHTRLGVETQSRSFSENELKAMNQKEEMIKTELEEYRKQVFELKENLSKQDRDHAERIQKLKREEHMDWMNHKETERELKGKMFEMDQMKARIAELEEEVITTRNAACLGAPSSKPSAMDVYLDDPFLAGMDMSTAPKPPTPPNLMPEYLDYPPHMGPQPTYSPQYNQQYASGYMQPPENGQFPQTTVFQQFSPQGPQAPVSYPQHAYTNSPNNTQDSGDFYQQQVPGNTENYYQNQQQGHA